MLCDPGQVASPFCTPDFPSAQGELGERFQGPACQETVRFLNEGIRHGGPGPVGARRPEAEGGWAEWLSPTLVALLATLGTPKLKLILTLT